VTKTSDKGMVREPNVIDLLPCVLPNTQQTILRILSLNKRVAQKWQAAQPNPYARKDYSRVEKVIADGTKYCYPLAYSRFEVNIDKSEK